MRDISILRREPLGSNLTISLLNTLGRAIVVGEFSETGFPREADLAERYGVSHSVTREAVKMLTSKGLLSARPRQGTMVRPETSWNLFDPDILRWILARRFSLTLLRQFTELRGAIEPAAAELAASVRSSETLDQIRAGHARMVSAERGEDDPLEADISFHIAILDATGNPFYAQFQEVVRTALMTSIRFTNRFKGHTASLPEHEAVLRAIEASDPPRAQSAMSTIVRNVMALIIEAQAQASLTPAD